MIEEMILSWVQRNQHVIAQHILQYISGNEQVKQWLADTLKPYMM